MGVEQRVVVVLGRFAALVGRGLRVVLGEDDGLCVAGFDLDAVQLEAACARERARVLILDAPAFEAQSSLAAAAGADEGVAVLVLAYRPTHSYCVRMLELGAQGCLSSEESAEGLCGAVRLLAEGKYLFAPVAESVATSALMAERPAVLGLTCRERTVLQLLSIGRTNSEIAHELQVTVETVRTHVAHVLRKLGASTRRELLGAGPPGAA